MSEQNKQLTQRVLKEIFEKGRLEAADELVHPEFVNHEAPPDSPQGPEGLKETVISLRVLWGPMRFDVKDEICEGDKVVARVVMQGRHVGEFPGEAAKRQGVRDQADPHLADRRRQADRALVRPR